METFWNKLYTYAIIGASNNETKFGNKVLKVLLENNYNVIPINFKKKTILQQKCYKSVLDYHKHIDVAIFIIPPSIGKEVIKKINKKNIKKVWFQPGSENEEIINYCKQNKINFIQKQCLLLLHK